MESVIFLLYSCDQWKSKDSERLVCASTELEKIKDAIIEEIKEGNMCYEDENYSVKKMLKNFNSDWDSGYDVDPLLIYGSFSCVNDGERE